MCVVVFNHQRAGDVRLFEPSTGMLTESNEHSWQDADGLFCKQDGSLICLFRSRGELHLYLDGANTTVDSDLTTNIDTHAQERRFRAFRGAELIYDKTYPRKPDTDGNPFWPSDAEDQDILLWVHNIVGSRERQQILLKKSHRE